MDIVGNLFYQANQTRRGGILALNIELSTVKTHVNNIYAKLRVNNREGSRSL